LSLGVIDKGKYLLDAFSGVGGWSLGAFMAGWTFTEHFFSEVDKYASEVFQKRFYEAIPLGDIRGVSKGGLPDGDWYIAGGFPCQDVSVAGRQAGIEVGTQSGLWIEFARVIAEFRPRFALVENVGNLTRTGLYRVLSDLFEAGYDAEWCDIRASDVGAPHRRERLWIVAYPRGARFRCTPGSWDEGEVFHSEGEASIRSLGSIDVAGSGTGSEALAYSAGIRQLARGSRQLSDGDIAKVNILCGGFGCAWSPESRVSPVVDGLSRRVDEHWADRIRCSGNALLPQIAALMWDVVGELDDCMEIPEDWFHSSVEFSA
jgi:DNA (cytosine-5)-methyltransferase 1